ncbi:hypothetical protein HHI36_002612 [Cryptolaemus montrouzieri]|uniref:Tropomodulin n=1 Tax=Cryptolaemus montrouzieri TaxID=559131 RepID=A0ABD2PBS9_9CUCU
MPPIAELSDLVATLDYQSAYHPFVSDTTLEVYDFVCRGNFILNHLNLSFNHLGADTLSDIHAVLTYQLTNGSSIEGLKSITVDGNHFQSDGTEQLQQEIADIFMQKRPRTGSSFPTVSIMTKRDKKRPSRGQ